MLIAGGYGEITIRLIHLTDNFLKMIVRLIRYWKPRGLY